MTRWWHFFSGCSSALSAFAAALIWLLAVALTYAMISSAHAQDGYGSYHWDWDLGSGDPHKRWHRTYRRHVDYYRAPERYDEERHYEIEAEHHGERQCLDRHVEVVSTEHTGSGGDAALISAHKLWSATTQWYFGSRFMNPDNAEDPKFVCDQSNAMDTLSGRLIDNAEKVLGNQDSANKRCVFRAIPCAQPMERAEEPRR